MCVYIYIYIFFIYISIALYDSIYCLYSYNNSNRRSEICCQLSSSVRWEAVCCQKMS